MFLNANVPTWECLVRDQYLYNLERGHECYTPVIVIGVASVVGRAVGFHVITNRGAMIGRLPVSALCWKQCEELPLDYLELWDCFSSDVAVTEYEWMHRMRCRTVLRNGTWYDGSYMFTLDWTGNWAADDPGETGWKCGHVLKLDGGWYTIQPNNRILWSDPSFVVKPFGPGERPDYLTNTHVWKCENRSKWVTEDSGKMFYETKGVE